MASLEKNSTHTQGKEKVVSVVIEEHIRWEEIQVHKSKQLLFVANTSKQISVLRMQYTLSYEIRTERCSLLVVGQKRGKQVKYNRSSTHIVKLIP